MSRRGCFSRLIVVTLALLVVAFVVVWFAGPRLAGRALEARLQTELEERELPVRVDGIDVGRGATTIRRLCLDALPPANGTLVCLEGIEVHVGVVAAVRGDVRVERVEISSAFVDGTSERGTIDEIRESIASVVQRVRGPRAQDPDREPRTDSPQRRRVPLPAIDVARIDVRLTGQGLPLQGALVESASVRDHGSARTAAFDLLPRELDGSAVGAVVPERWHVELAHPDTGAPRLTIGFDEPLSLSPLGEDGPRATMTGATVAMPATARLTGLRVDVPTHATPLVETEFIEIELREFTTSLDDLYLARLEVEHPRVVIPLTSDGELAMLPHSPETRVEPEGSGAAAPTPPGAAADTPSLWEGRRWWEKLPQTISVSRGEFAADIDDVGTFGVRDATFEYAIRAINTQLDVEVAGTFVAAGDPAGTLEIDAAWDWAHQNLELDLAANGIDLGVVSAYLGPWAGWQDIDGQLNLTTRFRQRTDRTIPDFSGNLSLDGLSVQLWRGPTDERRPVFSEPLRFAPISYTWAARQERDDEERRLVWQTGDVTVGDATLSFTPTLYRLELHRRRIVRAIDVAWEIPRQPVQPLLQAIPPSLLGEIADVEMEGMFGWEFAFPIRWVEGEDGERRFDLDEPITDRMDDDDLRLVSLPSGVDVRRLEGPFEFVFRGPDDSILREMRVPAPRDPELETDARALRDWVRLDEIAYSLIAAQLYREDGRFFTNSGVNWYQMRLVLEEAVQTGWPERGASTIPMQLIKNVFLTHDRTVERKLQELFLTYWMTRLIPKERILEIYLNVIEWGPDVNGIVEAADYYFASSPADLSLPESVWLASITPAPPPSSAGPPATAPHIRKEAAPRRPTRSEASRASGSREPSEALEPELERERSASARPGKERG